IGNVFADTDGFNFELTWKLPQKLRDDLKNPKLKWIILINPPFATASAGMARGSNKVEVAETRVRKHMHDANLGETSRELFAQFIYRIKKEFENRNALLGMFSTLKYVNANNDQKLRDNVFNFQFENGFVFSSANFSGTNKNNAFPIGFLLWDLSINKKIEKQKIKLDVFDEKVVKIGTKLFQSIHKSNFLSKWVSRPPARQKFPPLGSAIAVKSKNKDRRDRIATGFLGSLQAGRNDFQHQNYVCFLSGPEVNAGAYSIIQENFEKSMVIHAAQRIPRATWLNDRDQFMKPNRELSADFVIDCTVWNLLSNSNQTAALKDVEYEGQTYQIHNHFFPFLLKEVKTWKIADVDIKFSLLSATDTFVARWLSARAGKAPASRRTSVLPSVFSAEAHAVLDAARVLYRLYFASLPRLRTGKFKIATWDAGWWQIKQSLQDEHLGAPEFAALKTAHDALKAKLLPQLSDYGIIQ
ncbi:MAG: hypothetical protein LBT53_10045, partial [Puniceicoccales bacterium]|nr:hypothetical protein [Puniceicoccales bacterium]